MGVDMGDYDHDGRLDIFVTEFVISRTRCTTIRVKMLRRCQAGTSHTRTRSHPYVGWGTRIFRHGQQGLAGIFVANNRACHIRRWTHSDAGAFSSAYPAVPQQSGWERSMKLHPPGPE